MLDNNLRIDCTFQIEKFTEKNITYQGPEFKNTVLDCGFARLYDSAFTSMCAWLNLGSSNAPVDVTQTGLLDRKFSTSSIFNNQITHTIKRFPNCYFERKMIFQFNVGTCTGTFRELGVSEQNNSYYFNRQLIKDSNGNPMDLVVASDEGLRITVTARIYISPEDSLFSQVYELNLNNNTTGTITFSNGTTTKTLSYAELSSPTELQYQLQVWLGVPKLYFTELSTVNTTYIYGFKYNETSLNLSIQSHTMSGGNGSPVLTEPQPHAAPIKRSFTLTNLTTNQSIEIFYKTRMPLPWETTTSPHRGTIQSPLHWYEMGYWYSPLWRYGFRECFGYVSGTTGTQTLITNFDPATGYYEKKLYIPAGALGVGDKTLHSFATVWDGAQWNLFDLDQTITLKDTEEFNIIFRFNFGRYTPT